MRLSAILATNRAGLIGDGPRLPWLLSKDLVRFRELTWKKPVIMGRKTFDSLVQRGFTYGLDDRPNIVLSRQSNLNVPATISVVPSASEAIAAAKFYRPPEAFVIGGAAAFDLFQPMINRVYLTAVDASDAKGDVYLSPHFLTHVRDLFNWQIRSIEFWCKAKTKNHEFDARHIVLDRL